MSDPLSTGCSALDDLLGGGLEREAVTQVYGPPAAGKTNLCLSAAVEAAAAGETAVVIDTEGLSVDRFEQIVGARAETAGLAVPDLAGRVVIESAYDFEQQEEAVRDAADFAEGAGLIVLDSATGFYRVQRLEEGEAEAGDTLRRVAKQVTHLLGLARRHDLAVAVTNQVYTDPDGDRARPLGGYTLEHWSGTILRLERFRGGKRRATVEKHRSRPAGESTRFEIVDGGLAGVDDPTSP